MNSAVGAAQLTCSQLCLSRHLSNYLSSMVAFECNAGHSPHSTGHVDRHLLIGLLRLCICEAHKGAVVVLTTVNCGFSPEN
eukprot:6207926-Pleurochrysis_carterae.AAC.2